MAKYSIYDISPAMPCVYKSGDKPVMYLFNTNDEAERFHKTHEANHMLFMAYEPKKLPKWDESCRIVCPERLWVYVGHYNGCYNETVCSTTWLLRFIHQEQEHPYIERIEIVPFTGGLRY